MLEKHVQIRINILFHKVPKAPITDRAIKNEHIKTELKESKTSLINAVVFLECAEKEAVNSLPKDAIQEPQPGAIADLPKGNITCLYDLIGSSNDYSFNLTQYNAFNFTANHSDTDLISDPQEYRVTLTDKFKVLVECIIPTSNKNFIP